MSRPVRIAPSILSADLGHLAAEVAEAGACGAEYIHVDVMDGSFVPNLTFGPGVVRAVRAAAPAHVVVDVHLMVVEPERHLAAFAKAGADIISVHAEATTHLQRTLTEIRALGKRAGLVLNPATSEEVLRYVLGDVDLVLAMTVNPGFGGQRFLPAVLEKVRAIRRRIDDAGSSIDLEVDGGVAPDTVRPLVEAGADVLVAGQSVFGMPDRAAAIAALRAAVPG